MPPVDSVSAAGSAPQALAASPPKQTMDAEVFLSLLVAQMKNQDPSSPMDTNDMMAQTTQLAMMEQLTALTDTFSENFALSMRQAAAALVGQHASYVDVDGTTQSGLVSKVSFEQGVPTVTIGDKTVALDAISGVTSPPAS
ncbi:flagellar hook capping protein [Microbacterium sp. Sa4CUA7]|uniref:Flagellar hook capping protein n=1 Tax=Microbacterium pullorum TaxID=2762236 RepID=A0ABR8S1S5_9MICO|nr:flagellar hook capping FlgD N-terminal domain-containing protein [Microbacterium pullorum]MBD7957433.1 flagellar hook capping protein [Microbacterium pullorum]